jgi:hypothetical protein
MCERWMHSFENFLMDVGPRPSSSHSIDRIDMNGVYEPGNVRWATTIEQSNNRRNIIFLTVNDETMALSAWAQRTGIPLKTLRARLKLGWDADRTIKTPLAPWAKAKGRVWEAIEALAR